jgi:hypothetical protein
MYVLPSVLSLDRHVRRPFRVFLVIIPATPKLGAFRMRGTVLLTLRAFGRQRAASVTVARDGEANL